MGSGGPPLSYPGACCRFVLTAGARCVGSGEGRI